MTNKTTSVCIKYKSAEGWHVFESDDMLGLYVASTDPKKAFEDVAPSIEALMLANKGIKVKAKPQMSFDEFVDMVASEEDDAANDQYLVMSDKRFLLSACA